MSSANILPPSTVLEAERPASSQGAWQILRNRRYMWLIIFIVVIAFSAYRYYEINFVAPHHPLFWRPLTIVEGETALQQRRPTIIAVLPADAGLPATLAPWIDAEAITKARLSMAQQQDQQAPQPPESAEPESSAPAATQWLHEIDAATVRRPMYLLDGLPLFYHWQSDDAVDNWLHQRLQVKQPNVLVVLSGSATAPLILQGHEVSPEELGRLLEEMRRR